MAPNAKSLQDVEEYDIERILMNRIEREEAGQRNPFIEEKETKKFAQQALTSRQDAKPSSATVSLWLIFWLSNNIALTLLNKATFSTFEFRYPFFLSFVHMVINYVGAEMCFLFSKHCGSSSSSSTENGSESANGLLLGGLTRHVPSRRESLILIAYSIIYSLNIAMGNVSLHHVSVNFNQMFRSLNPAVTIFFSFVFGRTTPLSKKLTVLPVMVGVALSCMGDVEYTNVGLIYTSAAVLLAGIKGAAAGEILTGSLKLHPMDLLSKLAPLAAIQCLILSFLTGEISSIKSRWTTDLSPVVNKMPMIALLSTGFLAFSLNISSLTCTKLTSPLTLCIAGNAKQALMIFMATILFQTPVSLLNGTGLVVVLLGSALYSYVSTMEEERTKSESSTTVSSTCIETTTIDDDDEIGDETWDENTSNNTPKDYDSFTDDETSIMCRSCLVVSIPTESSR